MSSFVITEETLNDEESLARQYIKYLKKNDARNKCWDDFFDHIKLPMKLRSDFLIGAILKQSWEIIRHEL
jgi:hypothetical protein